MSIEVHLEEDVEKVMLTSTSEIISCQYFMTNCIENSGFLLMFICFNLVLALLNISKSNKNNILQPDSLYLVGILS